MNSSSSSITATDSPPATASLKVPRLDSLLHQLQHAKDAEGQPIALFDELLLLLDDPPPGTSDRWQKGADLCQSHGIKTSRMSVWRLYRANILQWRREQNPTSPGPLPDQEEIARLHDQARHLAAQRVLETLNDPGLTPGHLIGIVQNDNQRQQIELVREQFKDRLVVRSRLEQEQRLKRIDREVLDSQLMPAQMEFLQKLLTTLLAVPPHTTP